MSLMQTTVVCIVYNYDGVAGVDTHAHNIWLCRTTVGVEKRGAYRFVHDDLPRQHPFEIGGPSAVNAIGTQLRDSIHSGLI